MQPYSVTSKHHMVQNLPKQLCTSAALPGESLLQKSVALRHNLQLREPTLCLSLCPVGRTFQCFCKAFAGPYCDRGELPKNILHTWPRSQVFLEDGTPIGPDPARALCSNSNTSMLLIPFSIQNQGFLFLF